MTGVTQEHVGSTIMGRIMSSPRQETRADALNKLACWQYRKIGQATQIPKEAPARTVANNVCNTNADTCCLGKNYVILNNTSRTANVYAYDTSIKTLKGVTIVSRATAYDDLGTNTPNILVVDKDLYYGNKLDHSLINPNQVRAYGINFWDNTFDRQRGLTIALSDEVKIQMQTMGTKILYKTRVPTELEMRTCHYITMTSPQAWDQSQVNLSETRREKKQNHLSARSFRRLSVCL